MYNKSIKSGNNYDDLEKGIIILISDYELSSLQNIEKYITKWNLREKDYKKVILTDVLEIYIIELPKFERYKGKIKNSRLDLWINFIKNPEVIDMSIKEIKKAKEVLEEISKDEHERYLAELRQKYIMDQKATEDAGYDKGLKDGMKQKSEEIAKNLLSQNIDLEIIIKTTGLTLEEIKQLKK